MIPNDVLLVSKILMGYEKALWQKIEDKSCLSNFDKRSSDFGSFSWKTEGQRLLSITAL